MAGNRNAQRMQLISCGFGEFQVPQVGRADDVDGSGVQQKIAHPQPNKELASEKVRLQGKVLNQISMCVRVVVNNRKKMKGGNHSRHC